MKIRVATNLIAESLRKILNIVSSRSTLSILNNVLFVVKENILTLTTTDLEVTVVTTLEVDVEHEGEITLPAKTIAQIINTLPEGKVEITSDSSLTTSISCGQAKFKIMGTDVTEFPKQTDLVEDEEIIFDRIEFGKTLKKIGFAVSTDQSRMVLNGILFNVQEGIVTTVATDGRRLTLVEKNLDLEKNLKDCSVILPNKVVNELQKILVDEGEISIKLTDSLASFAVDNTVITSKLIAGSYPNYRQVIPDSFKNSVTLPRESFSSVLNRVSIVASDSGSSIKFKLESDLCTLSASSPEIGEAEEPFSISYEGEPVTISFNPGYLKDPLKYLECDEITIRFNDEFKPVVILGDEGFLYVIMPMRN